MLRDARGFSLVETLVSAGIVATLALAIAQAHGVLRNSMATTSNRASVDIARQRLSNLIQTNVSWDKTVSMNGGMTCLTNATTTTPGTTTCTWVWFFWFFLPICTTTPPVTQLVPCTNVGPAQALPMVLYDAQGTPVYDATNPNNGITSTGEKCGPHATNPGYQNYNYGTQQCPYRFNLSWFATQGINRPTIGVNLQVQTTADINKSGVNTDRYSLPTIYRAAQ